MLLAMYSEKRLTKEKVHPLELLSAELVMESGVVCAKLASTSASLVDFVELDKAQVLNVARDFASVVAGVILLGLLLRNCWQEED